MAWLPDGEKISKISLFVLAQHTNMTQTDRHRVPAIAALMHSIVRQKRCKQTVPVQLIVEDVVTCHTSFETQCYTRHTRRCNFK